jgi:hypothetical protein
MMAERTHGLVGAGIAAGAAGFELVRLIVGGSVGGLDVGATIVSSAVFIAVLAATAIGFAMHRRFGWTCGVFGTLALLGYGIVLQAASNHQGHVQNGLGLAYMILGLAMAATLPRSLPWYREQPTVRRRGVGHASLDASRA